ncbi:MAG: hypothetical protein HYR85_13170 [Planctomycetes bacterium]|nr:hypothetical protein [Planctomycetota bacterium]MBI3847855.1 hypothetical protein [Planctomycetota bacterium]
MITSEIEEEFSEPFPGGVRGRDTLARVFNDERIRSLHRAGSEKLSFSDVEQ